MNKTLAFIGSGNVGGILARLAVAAGLDVVLSNSAAPSPSPVSSPNSAPAPGRPLSPRLPRSGTWWWCPSR